MYIFISKEDDGTITRTINFTSFLSSEPNMDRRDNAEEEDGKTTKNNSMIDLNSSDKNLQVAKVIVKSVQKIVPMPKSVKSLANSRVNKVTFSVKPSANLTGK